MSEPLDGELAWAIGSWAADGDTADLHDRANIESLARHLSAQGFTNKKAENPLDALRKLRPTVESIFASADEFLGGPKRDSPKA